MTYDSIMTTISGWLWGWPLIILLIGTHILMTVRTGFIQRKLPAAIKLSITKEEGADGDISPFQALTTALAATVGTGNIVGVGTAIALGGPGAVLWTWIAGILGMATKYSEAYIAVKYRQTTPKGEMIGGTMYALEKGLGAKWAGLIFAALTLIATFGIGSSVQSNSSAILMEENFSVMPVISGIIFTVLVGLVLIGGIRQIGRVCEKIVPIMAVIYIVGCIVILVINRNHLLDAIAMIAGSAFSGKAVFGGAVGGTVLLSLRYGIARGLFSNESGMGSASFLAAAARTKIPARQALVSMTGTFWDTVVICFITGLVLVSTMVAHPEIVVEAGRDGSLLTTAAFAQMGVVGPWLLTFGLLAFSVTTMIGWSYYGDRSAVYLFGEKAVLPYRLVYLATIFAGAVVPLSVVWNTADVFNALMAIPNLICLILLNGKIAKETKTAIKDVSLL